MTKRFDVYGVGNAMVDILAMVPDEFVAERDLAKGGMMLVNDEVQGDLLFRLEGQPLEMQSGGSAANTMIGIAQSGGTGFYVGKIAHDSNGEFYRQDMLESGIEFEVEPAPAAGQPTGTCLVLTTPDAERTMCTHLGVSTELSTGDIDVERLKQSKYAYIEGYLWDPPAPRAASLEVMEQCKRNDVKVSLTYSDPFLVDRFGDDFKRVTHEFCDIIFCNADEIRQLAGTDSLDDAARFLGERVELGFITDGAEGCLVVAKDSIERVPGFSVKAIDTVGAGDAFAGGVLFGLTHDYSPAQAAKWGNYLAAQVVTIQGARLPGSVQGKVAEILGPA